jgi:hypothetical protein
MLHSKIPDPKPTEGHAPTLVTYKPIWISFRYISSKTSYLAVSALPSQTAPSWTCCAVQMNP